MAAVERHDVDVEVTSERRERIRTAVPSYLDELGKPATTETTTPGASYPGWTGGNASCCSRKRTQRRWGWAGLVVAVVGVGALVFASVLSSVDSGSPGTSQAVARGGLITVSGASIACRVGTGTPVGVECGPIDSAGRAAPGKLRGRLSLRSVEVIGTSGRRIFYRAQPPTPRSHALPATSTSKHVELEKDTWVFVAGTNLGRGATEASGTRASICVEATDRLATDIVRDHYALVVGESFVAVTRTDRTGQTTPVYFRRQSA